MAASNVCDSIRSVIAQLTAIPISDAVRNPDWGKANFEAIESEINNALDLIKPYQDLPIEIIPDDLARNILQAIDGFWNVFNRMKEFDINNANNQGIREDICNQIRNQSASLYPLLTPHIPYLAYKKGNASEYISEAIKSRDETRTALEQAKSAITEKSEEIETIIRAAREASASVGVAHFTSDFSKAEKDNITSARIWLWAAAIGALATLGAAGYSYFHISDIKNSEIVPMLPSLIAKIFILGLLASITMWCARIYKARQHLAILSRHRSDAIKTFQAFVKATENDAVRDAVLLETTRSIFSVGQTGFIDGSDSSGIADLRVVELIKAAANAQAK